ncbi:hypothetical protein ACIBCN_18825 [Nocardia sp. NPDC051052]|uniref:hypothetical protein n=1 Tax=Nocardia sp. NPDC051052 TaxID=3364322 RepID=UPI00378923A8
MRYSSEGADFSQALRSAAVKRLVHRKAEAGAAFWQANSRARTGYNASHVRVISTLSNGKEIAVIHAWGYYAKWRELGTRWNQPERVLYRARPIIKATP